jgi:hypothetical protein
MKLLEGGLSVVNLAPKGSREGNSFGEQGIALVKGDYGTALLKASGSFQGSEGQGPQEFNFGRRMLGQQLLPRGQQ